jgi:hypothetical protein
MPTPIDPRGKDNPSQYFVEDRSSNAEMIRLMIYEQVATSSIVGAMACPRPGAHARIVCAPSSLTEKERGPRFPTWEGGVWTASP